MTCGRHISCTIASFALLLPAWTWAKSEKRGDTRAASALFDRFETVVYSQIGLVTASGIEGSTKHARSLRRPFVLLRAGLDSLGSQTASQILETADGVFVGAKDFRPPAGLGGARSQFCYVVIRKKYRHQSLRSYFQHNPIASVDGAPIWSWSAMIGEFGEDDRRPSSLYASQTKEGYLLISNNIEELQAVAEKLGSPHDESGNLAAIRHWRFVRPHDTWGYRRFPDQGFVDRLAHPKMPFLTPGTEALMFVVDWKKGIFSLRILLRSSDNTESISKLNGSGALPPLIALEPGTWQVSFPVGGTEEQITDRLHLIFGLLGFAAYT